MTTKYQLVLLKETDGASTPHRHRERTRIDLSKHVNRENAVVLGREGSLTHIFAPDDKISRRHCQVWVEKNKVVVKDMKSLNTTLINGNQLVPDREYTLLPGQILQMGGPQGTTRLKLEAVEAPLTVVPTLLNCGIDNEQPGYSQSATLDMKDFTGADNAVLQSRLKWLYETSLKMSKASNLGGIIEICLDQVMAAFQDACQVLLVLYKAKEELPDVIKRSARAETTFSPNGLACARFRANETWDTKELKLSRTILNRVKNEKVAFWINAKDTTLVSFPGQTPSDTFNRINAVMAAPLISGDKNLGLIQLYTYKFFNDEDVNILRLLTAQTSLIIRNIQLAYTALEEETRRKSLERRFSPSIAEKLFNGSLKATLGGELRDGTIFYSDICGFCKISSPMRPEDVMGLLNRYFHVMQQLIFRRGGSVDKCAGDQIMAFWGILDDQNEYPAHAVAAGLEMQIALYEFNRDEPARKRFALPEAGLAHGIGLHTGQVCAGNIGGAQKIEFTVIGDVVNVANRIESAAGRGQVFVGESTWEAIKTRGLGFTLPQVSLKNVKYMPTLVAVRGIVPPGAPGATYGMADMLLNLPCEVRCGTESGLDCLVTGFMRKSGDKGVFVMQTPAKLLVEAECAVEWRIPEFKGFASFVGKVLKSEPPQKLTEDDPVPLASDARCGRASDDTRIAPGTAVIEVAKLPPEWLDIQPGTLWKSSYLSEHEIIR